ncbi:MAG: YkgJ family cysteine cluster protein [Archaeoglobaceae archaeon]|nr:YkgJ family cysteine cluster protein [Archaeoglobaceae archaeon]MDW7989314.1 YkgJ family cysteine cluster protein [Archaeoglobaceae archaeon]
MFVPWRLVASWHCEACGACCVQYRVRLRTYEFLKLRKTGFVEERAGRFYIKKIGKFCPFQSGNLCSLGNFKPLVCKIYPFSILKRGEELASFEFEGEEFFVYVDSFCKNVKIKKDPKPSIEKEVIEALEIMIGRRFEMNLLTAKLIQETRVLQQPHIHRLKELQDLQVL